MTSAYSYRAVTYLTADTLILGAAGDLTRRAAYRVHYAPLGGGATVPDFEFSSAVGGAWQVRGDAVDLRATDGEVATARQPGAGRLEVPRVRSWVPDTVVYRYVRLAATSAP